MYNAIVWQCRRTAELCEELKRQGLEERIVSTTGLLIDAYFSGTKIRWILDNVPGARQRAERGELLFGTVETWLIWKLTGGRPTSPTTPTPPAPCSLISTGCAGMRSCAVCCGSPPVCCPGRWRTAPSTARCSRASPAWRRWQAVPVCGAAGDQQAALFGQACFRPGEAKNTYGTGCFTLMNVGTEPVPQPGGAGELRGMERRWQDHLCLGGQRL